MRKPLAILITIVVAIALHPGSASGQRFGGQFGGGAAFWLVYIDPGLEAGESFNRDVGNVVGIGGRAFFQTGRFRLGGGAFGGSFTDAGLNSAGNEVDGGMSGGGFIAEYLIVQRNVELAVGGMAGGGVVTVEERISVAGDVEELRRRRESTFAGYPWVRLGYNLAPFVNAGLHLGYFIGTSGVGGFGAGIDITVGLIP
ncbi:MAG: hypothetical protein GWN99_01875 [Gemmatimonadetes bacterium]|uniref:Outer membrane protein beta-barrel domain-containing protein n=1 Tax=Candidatus Kutchimonas denitrificans TaxID=3056748 RepID=A0AAE5CB73_9BACT|nr:hypothetical protein [Gemmatimonadota bacterium]NIR74193.1 hypothetical protein [Candidatus Kutchimonas denitrificans]NIR99815.1 hypothetical protein [Gemmatimonadota bacterium]NIT65404.1 hypothetical protein [Gemmatimonadota bacterium]NIU51770.1 hypothetical protein [Gemmatimonadota bacterium]